MLIPKMTLAQGSPEDDRALWDTPAMKECLERQRAEFAVQFARFKAYGLRRYGRDFILPKDVEQGLSHLVERAHVNGTYSAET